MNQQDQQDLNTLTEQWRSDTNWFNQKIDEFFKSAQHHAYSLGLKRGLNVGHLSDEKLLPLLSN